MTTSMHSGVPAAAMETSTVDRKARRNAATGHVSPVLQNDSHENPKRAHVTVNYEIKPASGRKRCLATAITLITRTQGEMCAHSSGRTLNTHTTPYSLLPTSPAKCAPGHHCACAERLRPGLPSIQGEGALSTSYSLTPGNHPIVPAAISRRRGEKENNAQVARAGLLLRTAL